MNPRRVGRSVTRESFRTLVMSSIIKRRERCEELAAELRRRDNARAADFEASLAEYDRRLAMEEALAWYCVG